MQVVGRKSEYSLYDWGLATYDRGDLFDHQASEGFIKIWGLPARVQATLERRKKS
jgi:argininosuccinate synthase